MLLGGLVRCRPPGGGGGNCCQIAENSPILLKSSVKNIFPEKVDSCKAVQNCTKVAENYFSEFSNYIHK